eukprot:SAG22_NODE_49_length_24620_cov_80.053587_16_plen_78_part_00
MTTNQCAYALHCRNSLPTTSDRPDDLSGTRGGTLADECWPFGCPFLAALAAPFSPILFSGSAAPAMAVALVAAEAAS